MRLLWAFDQLAPVRTQRWLGAAAIATLVIDMIADNIRGTGLPLLLKGTFFAAPQAA